MTVKFKILDSRATVPSYATEYSAGADLYNLKDERIEIAPSQTKLIHTGIALEIPQGYVGLIFARSGLATKRGLAPANKVGFIDSDYRGEIMVSIYNQSDSVQFIDGGERVAQISIVPYLKASFSEAKELSDTVRGEGGFGSTGNK